MKVDLVMWAKNGNSTLWNVLNQINKVVPAEYVNNRILINDHSSDGTPAAAYFNGWKCYVSPGHGISDAANYALSLVESEYFCSFEQDVLLNRGWWRRVSPMILGKRNVAAACGIRFIPEYNFCYNVERYNMLYQNGYGRTLDNTIFNTDAVKAVGGFPKLTLAGQDTCLANRLANLGFKWLVNRDVVSLHVHHGFKNELRRYYFYGASLPQINEASSRFLLYKFFKSPVAALHMSSKMGDSRLMVSYPTVRLYWLLGYLHGKQFSEAKN